MDSPLRDMKKIYQKVKEWFAIPYGTYFSLDRHFRKNNATAHIVFIDGSIDGGSIILTIGDTRYYFEGKPTFDEYTSNGGNKCKKKTLKYGGWEVSLRGNYK